MIYEGLFPGKSRVCHFRSADDCVHDQAVELFKDTTTRRKGIWRKCVCLLWHTQWFYMFSPPLTFPVCLAAGRWPPSLQRHFGLCELHCVWHSSHMWAGGALPHHPVHRWCLHHSQREEHRHQVPAGFQKCLLACKDEIQNWLNREGQNMSTKKKNKKQTKKNNTIGE